MHVNQNDVVNGENVQIPPIWGHVIWRCMVVATDYFTVFKPFILCTLQRFWKDQMSDIYNSGNPGIGNFPAKASTSFRISLVFTWYFSFWASSSLNSFKVALGFMFLWISNVNSMPKDRHIYSQCPTRYSFANYVITYNELTLVNELANLVEIVLQQPSGRKSGRSQAKAAWSQSTFITFITDKYVWLVKITWYILYFKVHLKIQWTVFNEHLGRCFCCRRSRTPPELSLLFLHRFRLDADQPRWDEYLSRLNYNKMKR